MKTTGEIHNCVEMTAHIRQVGMLPLLNMNLGNWSAEAVVDEECQYIRFPDGGWEWQLWQWKGQIIQETQCAYGKFFAGKAGFITQEWWADFCNYRRSKYPYPPVGSIEETILFTLKEHGSMITRELRKACGFDGPRMRSRFDAYITRLQMATYIVTQDFIYPEDKHGRPYGWGWALLTTPEQWLGADVCVTDNTVEQSKHRLITQLRVLLPDATNAQIKKILG